MKHTLLLLLLPLVLLGQQDYNAQLDTYIQSAVRVNGFSGSVLVARAGNVILDKTYGYQDLGNSRPLDQHSMFEIGQMTEEFTAAAILLLEERDMLKLSDPVTKYIPELPYGTVTIHHMLTHTSGLPDYWEIMRGRWGEGKMASNEDMINFVAASNTPLLFKPGERYEMCFTDYPVLGTIIERVSGMRYGDFLEEHIFRPLQMHQTDFAVGLETKSPADYPYLPGLPFDPTTGTFVRNDQVKQFPREYIYVTDSLVGWHGIRTTASDLYRWNTALMKQQFLRKQTLQKMLRTYATRDSARSIGLGYGKQSGRNELGRFVYSENDGNYILGSSGSLLYYPDQDITLVCLCNKPKVSSNIGGYLAYIMFKQPLEPLYVPKEVSIDTSLLGRYTGRYRTPYRVELLSRDGFLYWRFLDAPEEPDLKLLPEAPNKFFSSSADYDIHLEFQAGPDGKVSRAFYISRGLRREMKREE